MVLTLVTTLENRVSEVAAPLRLRGIWGSSLLAKLLSVNDWWIGNTISKNSYQSLVE